MWIRGGAIYLTDSQGNQYSGWYVDSNEDWYYFDDSNKAMKTGWHHDGADGYWYYLNPSDGKMVRGWQTIDGKEYFFQPVRNVGNYYFSSGREKWLYSLNSNVPYGAMYVSTTTPDGFTVDSKGVKTSGNGTALTVQNGWAERDGKWYYYENGAMVSGSWRTLDGKSYYFGNDGALYVNTVTPDGSQVDGNGVKIKKAAQFSDTSFVGWYGCAEWFGSEYHSKTDDDEYYESMKNSKVKLSDYRDLFIEIKSIKDGYVNGYYCDGSTGASLSHECDFRAKIEENGVARYTQDHGSYMAEMIMHFYKENGYNKISLELLIHKKSNFDSIADDYTKMELQGVNEENPYYSSQKEIYIKYR